MQGIYYRTACTCMYAGSQSGGVVVLDWRGGSGEDSCWSKYHPHTREITGLAFAPWKLENIYVHT